MSKYSQTLGNFKTYQHTTHTTTQPPHHNHPCHHPSSLQHPQHPSPAHHAPQIPPKPPPPPELPPPPLHHPTSMLVHTTNTGHFALLNAFLYNYSGPLDVLVYLVGPCNVHRVSSTKRTTLNKISHTSINIRYLHCKQTAFGT